MAEKPPRLRARLDHIALNSPDPGALAEFYRLALDMEPHRLGDDRWLCHAPQRRILIAKGGAKTLAFGAYAIETAELLAAVRERASRVGTAIEPSPTPLFADGAFAVRDPDGNRIALGVAAAATEPEPAGVLPARLQHLVFGSDEVQRLADFYEQVLGFTISDRVFDKSGRLTNCFFRADRGDHHVLAIFPASQKKLDHHCYESIDWGSIRDWSDQLSGRNIPIAWGPGRHGPGANLFIMVRDPEGNWVEISAELEQVDAERPAGVWQSGPEVANRWGQPRLNV
jgi:catechol 2,3-dioxygenase-like lactoylglutathione lyase family enzyme